jgi:hypothetical protein
VYSSSGTAGDYDPTLDPQNPLYKIIAPKTGKVLSVLKPCTLQIASVRKGSASIAFRRGRESIVLPEFNRSVDPTSKDSIIIFTPPQSILNQSGTTTILNGSGWVAYAQDYGNATFSAVSGAFSFYDPNPPSSILGDNGMSGSFGFFHTSVLKAGQLHLQLPKGDIQLRIYSTMGKMLWEQSISSTVPRQFRLSLALPDQSVIVKF